jgi:hypothetical protein
VDTWQDLLVVLLAPVAALLGVYLTLRHQEKRELREARRAAYVKWLKLSRRLMKWAWEPEALADPLGGYLRFVREFDDMMAEVQLVASDRVGEAVTAFHDVVGRVQHDAEYKRVSTAASSPSNTQREQRAAERRVEEIASPARSEVIAAMRRDLGTTKSPKRGGGGGGGRQRARVPARGP